MPWLRHSHAVRRGIIARDDVPNVTEFAYIHIFLPSLFAFQTMSDASRAVFGFSYFLKLTDTVVSEPIRERR